MIITKTPYRISFFGGGSDYPDWFNKYNGQVLSATINKHIYITCRFLPNFFKHKYRIVWSKIENVKKINTLVRSIPDLEQGIYFSKSLYFSIGGIGSFRGSPFSEISKRLYSRIDPQKPLSPLIIRTKNLALDL